MSVGVFETLLAVRDVFWAPGHVERRQRLVQLLPTTVDTDLDTHLDTDLDSIETDFNRLFVGPGPVAAPPWASVYLDPDGLLMGATAQMVADLYARAGLEPLSGPGFPADHLSLELDACCTLELSYALDAHATPDGVADPELGLLCGELRTHLAAWVPLFAERVRRARPHPVWASVLSHLSWAVDALDVTSAGPAFEFPDALLIAARACMRAKESADA